MEQNLVKDRGCCCWWCCWVSSGVLDRPWLTLCTVQCVLLLLLIYVSADVHWRPLALRDRPDTAGCCWPRSWGRFLSCWSGLQRPKFEGASKSAHGIPRDLAVVWLCHRVPFWRSTFHHASECYVAFVQSFLATCSVFICYFTACCMSGCSPNVCMEMFIQSVFTS